MARKLGDNQRHFLRAMLSHGAAMWYAGCGWVWGTRSESERIAESLVRRGLVEREVRRFIGRGRIPSEKTYWKLTAAGREAATAR